MNNQLEQLLNLQSFDQKILECDMQLERVPQLIAEKKSLIDQAHSVYESEKKSTAMLQLSKKEKEGQIVSLDEKIRKHESELNSVKSNDAYKALLLEIENAKKQKSAIEDEILQILMDQDVLQKKLKDSEIQLKSIQSSLEVEIKNIQLDQEKITQERKKIFDERELFSKEIVSDLLNRYDYIRLKKKTFAIAVVSKGICGGCHTQLTTSMINEIKKSKELFICESCSRILYSPPEVEEKNQKQ